MCLDSLLLVNQLNGDSKVKAEYLKPLHEQAAALVQQVADIKITWVPRGSNAEAMGPDLVGGLGMVAPIAGLASLASGGGAPAAAAALAPHHQRALSPTSG